MKPIVLYTNLFTLADTDIRQNKYIDMYYFWVHNIIQYAKLKPTDICITMIDNVSFEYIKKQNQLDILLPKINMYFVIYPQPTTIKDGMMNRYQIQNIINISQPIQNNNPYYIYLDVDVFIIKDIRKLFINSPETTQSAFFIKAEGLIMDGNYLGDIITEPDEIEKIKSMNIDKLPGFSSGIFAWTNCPHINDFFIILIQKAMHDNKKYYTVDQPFFNYTIVKYLMDIPNRFTFVNFDNNLISHNEGGLHASRDYVLVNLCGEPGQYEIHWNKIISQVLLQNIHPEI
jgi:hypothetical protein